MAISPSGKFAANGQPGGSTSGSSTSGGSTGSSSSGASGGATYYYYDESGNVIASSSPSTEVGGKVVVQGGGGGGSYAGYQQAKAVTEQMHPQIQQGYTVNLVSGQLERNVGGAIATKPIHDIQTAQYTVGEALQRGYVQEKVDEAGVASYFYQKNLSPEIKASIEKKIRLSGYDLVETDSGLDLKKRGYGFTEIKKTPEALAKPKGGGAQYLYIELGEPGKPVKYLQGESIETAKDTTNLQGRLTYPEELVQKPVAFSKGAEAGVQLAAMAGRGEKVSMPRVLPPTSAELRDVIIGVETRKARETSPFTFIPFIGESAATLKAGLEMRSLEMYGDQLKYRSILVDKPGGGKMAVRQLIPESRLPSLEYAAAGYVGTASYAYGATSIAGASLVGDITPVALKIGGQAASGTAFRAVLSGSLEGIGAITEGRDFRVESITSAFEPRDVVGTALLGPASSLAGSKAFFGLGSMGVKAFPQQVAAGAASGATFGISIASSSQERKDIAGSAAMGAVLGGAFAGAGYLTEKAGYHPVAETTRVNIVDKGAVEQKITGFKLGIERINPKSGELTWFGKAYARDIVVPKGAVVQPTGVFETFRYAPELVPQYKAAGLLFYGKSFIDTAAFENNIAKSFGKDSNKVLEAIRIQGGVIGGGTVEKALADARGAYSSSQYSRGVSGKDVDDVFYYNEAAPGRLAKSLGTTAKVKEMPLAVKGYPQTATKYEIPYKGKTLDVTVMYPSFFDPRAATPIGQLATAYSFQKTGQSVTYSPQQQIATKGMTIGVAGGKIAPIEKGKEKYLSDIKVFMDKAGVDIGASDWAMPTPAYAGSVGVSAGKSVTIGVSQPSAAIPKGESYSPVKPSQFFFSSLTPSRAISSALGSKSSALSSISPSRSVSSPSPSPSMPSPSFPSRSSPSPSSSISSVSPPSKSSSPPSFSFSPARASAGFTPSIPFIPIGSGGGGGLTFGKGAGVKAKLMDMLTAASRVSKTPLAKASAGKPKKGRWF